MSNLLHLEAIKSTLTAYIDHAHATGTKGDANWTYEIKARLRDLGREFGYEISTSGFRGDCEPEWLFDLAWYREEGDAGDRRLVELALAAECEWNLHLDFIKYDFEKLLVSNANLRLMICQASDKLKEERLNYFREAITKYSGSRPGDTFLIALLSYEQEEFYFETIVK